MLLQRKDFFVFQFEFAKELYNKKKENDQTINLLNVINSVAPIIREQVLEYDEDKSIFIEHLKAGITEENLIDKAYETYLQIEKESDRSIIYGPIQKFGPLSYVTYEDNNLNEKPLKDNISFHFSNNYDMTPRQLLNIEERKKILLIF